MARYKSPGRIRRVIGKLPTHKPYAARLLPSSRGMVRRPVPVKL